jgi:hypothetical protein
MYAPINTKHRELYVQHDSVCVFVCVLSMTFQDLVKTLGNIMLCFPGFTIIKQDLEVSTSTAGSFDIPSVWPTTLFC